MTDQDKAMGNEAIEWTMPGALVYRLHVETWDGLGPHGQRMATTEDLSAAGFVPKAELEAYDRAISEFDAWLGEQAAFFVQNPQVNRTFLDVAAKLMHTLRTVPVKPTPEPGEPVGGKDGPVETAGETGHDAPMDVEFGCDPGDSAALESLRMAIDDHLLWTSDEASEAGDYEACVRYSGELARKGKNFDAVVEQLQSALTRAEGRVRELEAERAELDAKVPRAQHRDVTDAELAEVTKLAIDARNAIITANASTAPIVRWLMWQPDRGLAVTLELLTRLEATNALRAQPPLASSVVADEATTGEPPVTRGVTKVVCPTCGNDRQWRRNLAFGKGWSPCNDPFHDEPEPSPLTGEEGKAERVDPFSAVKAELAQAWRSYEWERDGVKHSYPSATCLLWHAMRTLVEALESRAAKEGSDGR